MAQQILEGFRLSPQQKRLWKLQHDSLASPQAQCVARLEGRLDRDLLREAVRQIIRRHEILRTTFQPRPGMRMPVQVIHPADDASLPETGERQFYTWRVVDQRDESERERRSAIEELFAAEAAQPFDPEQGTTVRLALVAIKDDEHLLSVCVPALCADASTLNTLIGELARSYAARLGLESQVEETMQYADFAAWQNELLEEDEAEAGRNFWRRQGAAPFAPQAIPLASLPRTKADTKVVFAPERRVARLDDALKEKLETLAGERRTSLGNLLQACWQVFLWRQARQPEMVVGRLFEGRKYEELKQSLGLFARCVPVRANFDAGLRLTELLAENDERTREADNRQEYWTGALPVSAPEASAAREQATAHLSLAFEFDDRRIESVKGSPLRFSLVEKRTCLEPFALKLVCARRDERASDALFIELHYDPQLLDAEAVRCLAAQFQQLLRSVVSDPHARLGELRLVDDAERRRLTVELNRTAREYDDSTRLVHILFEEQAKRTPERVAVVCEDGELSYAELNARSNQLAHHLRSLGIRPEAAVGLCLERSRAMVVGLLGILKAGGAYLPLDAGQPPQRLAMMLADASARLVLTQASLQHLFEGAGVQSLCLDTDESSIAAHATENPRFRVDAENLVYVIFTSGSTGRPKGVAVEHRQLVNYLRAASDALELPPGASYATVSTIAADLGNTMIYPAWCSGGTLHIISPQRATDPAALADYFSQHRIDCLKIVPSHLEAMLAQPGAILPGQRLVLGGESSRREWIERVRELAPGCQIFNHYGPTETTVGTLTTRFEPNDDDAPRRALLPLGRPLANTEVYLLDERMQVVGTGEVGEVYIGGAGVTRGYLGQPAPTAEKFVPDPFGARAGARLYRTGDLARHLPCGSVEFVGRADNQVKFHGHRVELDEIKSLLCRHPDIRDSVVVIRKEPNGEEAMVAYYIAPEELEVARLREFLGRSISEQVMPNAFVQLNKFPLTANGKIDGRALPSLEEVREGRERQFTAPRTRLEETLAGVWAQMLGVKQVGIEDNFFELGGHSLLATRVISKLREVLKIEVPFQILFDAPTVAGMSARLEEVLEAGAGRETARIERAPRDAELPLSSSQQRLWFLHQLEPNSSSYNCAAAVRLSGELKRESLEAALGEVARRHEILHTTFPTIDGRPVQLISADAAPLALPVVNLTPLPEAERQSSLTRLSGEEVARPFDLAAGPLLRVKLVRLEAREHVLILTMHHIVSDAWSTGVLVREASILYDAFARGLPSPLPELRLQYADFAHWQQQLMREGAFAEQLAYWTRLLGDRPPMLELPTARPRPDTPTLRGATHPVHISRSLVEELRAFGHERGVTLYMTLVAAFKVLLHFYARQDDLVVGTDVANRNRSETEGLIGFFVNQLVLRTDLSGDPQFEALLERVREVTLGAFDHQDLPFDKLVEALKPERTLKYAPFFQVKIVLENTPRERLELSGLTLTPLEIESTDAKLDLILLLKEHAGGLEGWFEYASDLFDADVVKGMAEQYELLLRRLLAKPASRVSELEAAVAEFERGRRAAAQSEREAAQRKMFKAVKPKVISLPADVPPAS
jgi:amino acid adenylation domain-containing protein